MRETPTDTASEPWALVHMVYLTIGMGLAVGAIIYLPYAATRGWFSQPTMLEFWLEFVMPAAIYLSIGVALLVRWLRRRPTR